MNTLYQQYSRLSGKKDQWPVVAFFVAYLLLGLFVYKDYGLYYDDHSGRENGVINGLYMAEEIAPSVLEGKNYCPECPSLAKYVDGDHGPIFELVPTFLEWLFEIKDLQKVFQLRHLCTFLLFYLSTVFFYLLLQERFRKPLLSLAGVLMLVISPRIFAESFYNSKDLPFLSVSIISTYTLVLFLKNRNYKTALWHALMCALAIDLRLLGLIFPALTVGFCLFDLKLFRKNGGLVPKTSGLLGIYFLALFAFVIVFWPYLWFRPFIRFPEVLARSSAFPWPGNVFFLGKPVPSTALPWHYLPVWILITTPVLYTILALAGLVQVGWQTIKSGFLLYRSATDRIDLAMAGLFVIPVTAAIVFKLVLYDSWRHLYFIYPALIYLAVLGLERLFAFAWHFRNTSARQILRYGFMGIWAIGIGRLVYWTIKNHPHQNVYFSIYSNDSVRQKFELDYWGLAYKQGLEFIVKDSDKPQINVYPANLPGMTNQFSLTPEQRKRLVYVDHISKADYFLTEYRYHPGNYPLKNEVYQIRVDGIKIFSVFKPDHDTVFSEFQTKLF